MRSLQQLITIVGSANGVGGRIPGCSQAALVMRNSNFLKRSGIPFQWSNIVSEFDSDKRRLDALPELWPIPQNKLLSRKKELVVIGGDHSCAMGTWSGVAAGVRKLGRLGLVWIDAHMDSHTPASSHSGNIHGMPVAHLLGHGDSALSGIFDFLPKIYPQNFVVIGARSFEPEEQEFLESLKVRVFYMDEVRDRGCHSVLKEAIKLSTNGTCGFGLSIDLDAFEPREVPAIGCPEKGGLSTDEFLRAVNRVDLRKLVASEIVEFLPDRDSADNRTEKLIVQLLRQIYTNKWGLR
ncbi:putative arginase [Aphelenchoides besseyi]|nr:putative arginase [Aphelenchoides besseyi]